MTPKDARRWGFPGLHTGLLTVVLTLAVAAIPGVSAGVRPRLVIVAGGDVYASNHMKQAAFVASGAAGGRVDVAGAGNHGWDSFFVHVRPLLAGADAAICNMESPYLPIVDRPGEPVDIPRFVAPPSLARAVHDAGFHIVNVANNHAHDMGAGGLEGTQDILASSGVVAAGLTYDGTLVMPHVTLATWPVRVFGATLKMNIQMSPGYTPWDVLQIDAKHPQVLLDAVQRASSLGETCVVCLHWGIEYGRAPEDWQVDLAHAFCEAGATLILAHHAHVAQRMEVYTARDGRRCFIAYGLGDLAAYDDAHPEADLCVLARVVLEPDAQGRASVVEASWQPLWCGRQGDVITLVALDDGTPLAAGTRQDATCARELGSAEQRLGPRTVFPPVVPPASAVSPSDPGR